MTDDSTLSPEHKRLLEDQARTNNWKRWGTYLPERQWGTVREDYSSDGAVWDYFPHEHARSRVYRWGEDGLLGLCDRQCRLCFSIALWNEKDVILKERLFGLTGPEGNHGEDVKEQYFYVDATPTYSYCKGIYQYPQAKFPYDQLIQESRHRSKSESEFELIDSGAFNENRYFDVQVEYAKANPNDILIRITVTNNGPERARIHVIPQLWFRNTWIWGGDHEDVTSEPRLERIDKQTIAVEHPTLGDYVFEVGPIENGEMPQLLFTDNETNYSQVNGVRNGRPWSKDAFHRRIVDRQESAVNPAGHGTKAGVWHQLEIDPCQSVVCRLRLSQMQEGMQRSQDPLGDNFEQVFVQRVEEANQFYGKVLENVRDEEHRQISRQAYAGLLWSKQFYHYSLKIWINGDPHQAPPPAIRRKGRNSDWQHLFNRDVISMPDKWEYPWYAAWDLAFHMIPFAKIDLEFAKSQLLLFLREWYMHPNGQMPAYEFNFSDVNPPVHAWACWRVYQESVAVGQADPQFLARAFQKLLLNFTWWVNRKDPTGRHMFSGGFLGLDNIGIFDRNQPLPQGGHLEQADGTAWMAFYALNMLKMALELAQFDPTYADMASKFLEHFLQIADAMNRLGNGGLWQDEDGFYYDQVWHETENRGEPIRIRSLVGLIPLIAVEIFDTKRLAPLQGFVKRALWFMENRKDLGAQISYMNKGLRIGSAQDQYILAIPSRRRLRRVLAYLLDPEEFLSPFGIRSLSRFHEKHPYRLEVGGQEYSVQYAPGESDTEMFGGNSNWRGPIWFPVNYLLIEALRKWHSFYHDTLKVECPTGSSNFLDLGQVADEIQERLVGIFVAGADGCRPYQHKNADLGSRSENPLFLFYEYFHGNTGKGMGASHQTGWTSLVATCIEDLSGRGTK